MQEFSFVSPRLFSYFHPHTNAKATMQPHGILEAALYASDVERADAFYFRDLDDNARELATREVRPDLPMSNTAPIPNNPISQ